MPTLVRWKWGLKVLWATRNGPCLHPFYCVLLSNERKNLRAEPRRELTR